MSDIHRHRESEELEKYSMGLVPPDEAEGIEEHLLVCESCQTRLREIDEYLPAMRMAARQVRREHRTTRERGFRFPTWSPVFAGAVCGLLLLVVALNFVRTPGRAVAVSLTALRNNGTASAAPAGRELLLDPDLTGLPERPSYRLEIVDQTGRPVRQGALKLRQNGVKVPGLGAGQYFVRIYVAGGELLREYGLEIR